MRKFQEYIIPLLVILVAGTQFFLANFSDLTPWKGGGFGMFSTYDTPQARNFKIYYAKPNEEFCLVHPSQAELREFLKARALPTKHLIENALSYVNSKNLAIFREDCKKELNLSRKDSYIVEYWKMKYSKGKMLFDKEKTYDF